VKLIKVFMRRITCSPGHICVQPENRRGTGVFLCPTESVGTLVKSTIAKEHLNLTDSEGFNPLIFEATRIIESTVNCIDHIFTNKYDTIQYNTMFFILRG